MIRTPTHRSPQCIEAAIYLEPRAVVPARELLRRDRTERAAGRKNCTQQVLTMLALHWVSQDEGPLFEGPCNKDHQMLGTILGSPDFGNSRMVTKAAHPYCAASGCTKLHRLVCTTQAHTPKAQGSGGESFRGSLYKGFIAAIAA